MSFRGKSFLSQPRLGVLGAGLLSVLAPLMAHAATLCVNAGGTNGCRSTISAAVTAASAGDTINVGRGTYDEMITIDKSVSLVGAGPNQTIIDATGLSNAIYINASNDVVVTGFTLEHAYFEGILVNGASSVTITHNHVIDNDQALIPNGGPPPFGSSSCPGLMTVYPFETNEAADCGEGIHLTNVNNSVVAYNTVADNSGGILVSDDSGPTYDNSISNNIIRNNVMDCGITVPSHTSGGVYHNTISRNVVTGNGTSPLNGFGAGIGLFSPFPPTTNYGNAVVDNQLIGNGIAGVALHTHAPGAEVLQDELIVGNFIARNGGDTDLGLDQASQGDGISIGVTGGQVSGIVISGNTFEDEVEDIAVMTAPALAITATLNNFGHHSIGVDNLSGSNSTINATEDWWGCSRGPGAPGCSTSSGSGVSYSPWLTNPLRNDGRHQRGRDF